MRGPRYEYVYYDEAFRWRTQPMIEAEKNGEGVYVITTAKEARQWRTNVSTNPAPFREATGRFFHPNSSNS